MPEVLTCIYPGWESFPEHVSGMVILVLKSIDCEMRLTQFYVFPFRSYMAFSKHLTSMVEKKWTYLIIKEL